MGTVMYVSALGQQKQVGGRRGGVHMQLKDKSFDYASEIRAETARLKTHADQHI